jgi:hypothetical protein
MIAVRTGVSQRLFAERLFFVLIDDSFALLIAWRHIQ